MAAKRFLLGVVWAGVVGSAVGQVPTPTPTAPQPGVPMTGAPTTPPVTAPPVTGGMPPVGGTVPYLAPAMPGATGPTATLTAPPGPPPAYGSALPPGSVASPWCGGMPAGGGCCGPVGKNGPISYELYARTGPDFVVGGGNVFTGDLGFGWTVQGGGRTLFMNPAGDAAWVLDLGMGYSFHEGNEDRVFPVFTPQPRDPQTGDLQGEDQLLPFRVREFHRTWFQYGIGRDWFLNGPGYVGGECSWNSRIGVDVLGRWGNARVNLIPVSDPTNYLRKNSILHALVLGAHWNWEMPMGAWVLFTGVRAEYVFNWTNVVPPQDGNVQDLNILLNLGVRF